MTDEPRSRASWLRDAIGGLVSIGIEFVVVAALVVVAFVVAAIVLALI